MKSKQHSHNINENKMPKTVWILGCKTFRRHIKAMVITLDIVSGQQRQSRVPTFTLIKANMLAITDDSRCRVRAVAADQWHAIHSDREVNPWWMASTVQRGSAVNWRPLPGELNVLAVDIAFTRPLVCLFHVPYLSQSWLHGEIKLVCALRQRK